MAFTSSGGTPATHHNDLLDKLRIWLTGLGGGLAWTQLAWTAGANPTDIARLHIRGPGAGSGKEVYINIQTRNIPVDGSYGWAITGSTGYDSNASWGAQPNESGEVFLNTWQNSIPYWFYANARRFMIVAKVSAAYVSMHAGFFLPFALPSEYPFPLYIAGNYPNLAPYGVGNARNRFFVDPGDGAAYYYARSGNVWKPFKNQGDSIADFSPIGTSYPVMWPFRVPKAYSAESTDWNGVGISRIRPNAVGELPMWAAHIIDAAGHELPGALDGAYATPGFGRSSEQTFTIGSSTYRLFQNVFRSSVRDFMAIEEV